MKYILNPIFNVICYILVFTFTLIWNFSFKKAREEAAESLTSKSFCRYGYFRLMLKVIIGNCIFWITMAYLYSLKKGYTEIPPPIF